MSKKILLLDDETEYIASLQKFLQEFNYAVGSTISSKQALELIRDDKPDLVLFDYKSLGMDGDVFFKKAKEICPSIPYILVTAWNDPAILERFKKMGVTDIILKPIDLKNLLSKLQKILGKGKVR